MNNRRNEYKRFSHVCRYASFFKFTFDDFRTAVREMCALYNVHSPDIFRDYRVLTRQLFMNNIRVQVERINYIVSNRTCRFSLEVCVVSINNLYLFFDYQPTISLKKKKCITACVLYSVASKYDVNKCAYVAPMKINVEGTGFARGSASPTVPSTVLHFVAAECNHTFVVLIITETRVLKIVLCLIVFQSRRLIAKIYD